MSEQDRRRIVALQEDNIKLIDEAERTRAEAARYRAALEEIVAGNIPALWGEDYSTPVQHCNACDASWPFGDRPAHTDNCPYAIAHRALRPEEEG